MENLVIRGKISTTSNKQSKEFKSESPKKTAYLEVDEKNSKLLEKFGVPKYTSKDGEDFHCVKTVDEVKIHFSKSENEPVPFPSTLDDPNYQTKDGVTIGMNIIKGNKAGNDFYRLQAVLLNDINDIEEIMGENPFSSFEL